MGLIKTTSFIVLSLLVLSCNAERSSDRSSRNSGEEDDGKLVKGENSSGDSNASGEGSDYEDGADVATDITGAYLSFPNGIEKGGKSIFITPPKSMDTAAVLSKEEHVPLDLSKYQDAEKPYLGLFYHVHRDAKNWRGFVELKDIKVRNDQAYFFLKGKGNYQVGYVGLTLKKVMPSVEVQVEDEPKPLGNTPTGPGAPRAPGGWTDVTMGKEHTCAINEGKIYCFGKNSRGQLGRPGAPDSNIPALVQTSFTDPFTKVRAGLYFTCGLRQSGMLSCWGLNLDGQLGNANNSTQLLPGPVVGGYTFKDFDVGDSHVCGTMTGAAVLCWGRGIEGQLGTGQRSSSNIPQLINDSPFDPLRDFKDLSLGGNLSCLSDTLMPSCWGQVAEGNIFDIATSVAIGFDARLAPATFINAVASNDGMCAESSSVISCTRQNPCFDNAPPVFSSIETHFSNYWTYISTAGNLREIERVALICSNTPLSTQKFTAYAATSLRRLSGRQCAIDENKDLFCWGNSATVDEAAMLGIGKTDVSPVPNPVKVLIP